MADSFKKKQREEKRRKRKREKAEQKLLKKAEGKKPNEFMYMDENGNLTSEPQDLTKKKEVPLEEIQISTPKDSELEDVDITRNGVVKFFNTEKRFGFITDSATGIDYFVHEESLQTTIAEKDKVVFEIGHGPKGQIAVNVELVKS